MPPQTPTGLDSADPTRRFVAPSRHLRILHVCRRFHPYPGGTERYVRDLTSAQAGAGHRVTVLTLDRDVAAGGPARLPARAFVDGVEVLRLPGWGTRQIALAFRPDRIVRAVRSHDVVHLHDVRFGLITALAAGLAAGRPIVLHTHGLIFHSDRDHPGKRIAMRGVIGPLLRISGARVVASSRSDHALVLRDAPYLGGRTVTFENAIPLDPLMAVERRPRPGRILTVGRVVVSKRLDDLLAALALLRDQEWDLLIAGEPDPAEVTRLRAIARRLGIEGRVTFLGSFPDGRVADVLAEAHMAAFPSRGEGFGIALLEAMAAGVPLVARDIEAHRELVGPELGSVLSDFDDPRVAAMAIKHLLVSPPRDLERLGAQLRKRATSYDISRLTAQIDELYAELGLLV